MAPQHPAVARVTRQFGASPGRVFDAWLDPDKVRVWWKMSAAAAGRPTETMERVQIDGHPGGTFSILVRRDGKLIDHTGTYLGIDRPRLLQFTWSALDVASHEEVGKVARDDSPDYSRVTIEITPTENGCVATLTHEMHRDWAEFVDGAENAWRIMLDAIDELLNEVPVR